ncbi:oxidoreductase alpha (molybdopterin) subunit [Cohaesibacter sp. ES.047]|uniref:FdhF/YdeP family oxidoreductase n=1 Tax=Cohaesibacter sp. ES.047 TaxID=1798205 RepID=UPI000BB822D5|nr:FdhF/YdeP family oxidoreductase [Cohaesibacter sp. ES.047]SNY94146.1 oxidoreductase alpha (molybdopterin) subunit [Cohaesibacter sp. ES.047]
MPKQIVGGGHKKVLYTLNTMRQIGVVKSAKALTSKNTCKSCALGMGGQAGGMVNEIGEYPAVCNKSVQAQSTDIQPPIPDALFDKHTIADLRELTGKEMETLGRLNTPLYKARDAEGFSRLEWDDALQIVADRLKATEPDRSFFYSSGRSSNEAAFLFQLIARMYGTNNVTNCSYFCHQATGMALGATIGTGTSTVELADLTGADLIFVIGANPASNHPRFIHKLLECRKRGGHVVVINPAKEPGLVRFASPKSARAMMTGGRDVASHYLQPKIGSDMALFKGIAKAIIEAGDLDEAFIDSHTIGFEAFLNDIKAISWDEITQTSGVQRDKIEEAARIYGASKSAVFSWGMGMTHHLHGVENIEYISALALMRGMVGRPNAGLLPLRGHSNVQGVGTIGVKPVLPEEVLSRLEEAFGIQLPAAKGLDTMASLAAARDGLIDSAVIMGGNLYSATPDTAWAREALELIGFKLFMTTTLNQGHVHGLGSGEVLILPVTARDEEWEPTTQESMFNFVRLSDGGIHRLDKVRPESVILSDLASRLLGDDVIDFKVFGKHQELRKAIAQVVPGMEDLATIDVAKREFHIRNRIIHSPDFKTKDGKAHFVTHPLPEAGDKPFVLSTMRSEGQYNSIVYEETDSYRGTKTRWSILMNAEDMKRLGIEPEAKADVTSPNGKMEGVTVYAFGLPQGSILAYYPEANVLTDTKVDPRSRTPAFKSVDVDVAIAGAVGPR